MRPFPDKPNEVLMELVSIYNQGNLVPFIGSGLSHGVCSTWPMLVFNLANSFGLSRSEELQYSGFDARELIVLADEVIARMRPLSLSEQIAIYRRALTPSSSAAIIPPATAALAELYWPIVVSTNYDDIFWTAAGEQEKPIVLGRSIKDSHAILHSLDEVSPPYIWAIQGFIGGQLSNIDDIVPSNERLMELASQLVLGHQQYQSAINSSPHFRRSFAELFRRRSFLFLGSGILEDYLVNLFSEIIHYQGMGPYPHFAFLKESQRQKYDTLFLQKRLGIVPVFYHDHSDLPDYLKALAKEVNSERPSGLSELGISPVAFQNSIGFKLWNDDLPNCDLQVDIVKSKIPLPKTSEGVFVSVGREIRRPIIGSQANDLLQRLEHANLISLYDEKKWIPVDSEPSYVFQYENSSIFGLCARRKFIEPPEQDVRDLSVVSEAVKCALEVADKNNLMVVHIGTIASGKKRIWDPIHSIAETLKGIGQFQRTRKCSSLGRVVIYVSDKQAWYHLTSNKVNLTGLLRSTLSTHAIQSVDSLGTVERFSVTLTESVTLSRLLEICSIDRDSWELSIYPRPTRDSQLPDDMIVTSLMRIVLSAKQRESYPTRW